MNNIALFKTTARTLGLTLAIILSGGLASWVNAGSFKEKVNTNFFGVAIKGYDTVAYFTEGRAIKGKSKYSHNWSDAKWYFSSQENRDRFAAEPERYAPQYGGY
jgi:YHS domain-containing protein